MTKLHDAVADVLQHFRFSHLLPHLQPISAPFALQAVHAVRTTPPGPGLTRALNHLRRAKDEAVTAHLAKRGDELQRAAQKVIAEADNWLATHGSPFVIADEAP